MVCPFLRQPCGPDILTWALWSPPMNSHRPILRAIRVLNWLTTEFIKSGYDMKWLHRQITSSQAYQRSWRPNKTNAEDQRNYSGHPRFPLIVYDAMKQVTAASDKLEQSAPISRRGTGHLSTHGRHACDESLRQARTGHQLRLQR